MANEIVPTTTDTPERQQELINLLNLTNNKSYTLNDLNVGVPAASSIKNRNTTVTFTAKPGSDFSGSKTIYYNRLSLNEITPEAAFLETNTTATQILDSLNQDLGTDVKATDVVPLVIPTNSPELVIDVAVKAKTDSLKWIGQNNVQVINASESDFTALRNFITTDWPSFV